MDSKLMVRNSLSSVYRILMFTKIVTRHVDTAACPFI